MNIAAGLVLIAGATVVCGLIAAFADKADYDTAGLALLAVFMVLPGLTYLGLAVFFKVQQRAARTVAVTQLREYGVILLQLLPGAVIAGVGNLIPNFGWISLAIGTLVSLVVVRRISGGRLK